MANENKFTTLGQMKDFAQKQDARDDAQDQLMKNHTHSAAQVKFSDGETFQAKHDSGKLTGETGKTAYEYARDGGYTGNESDFATKLAADYMPLYGNIVTASGNGSAYTATVPGVTTLKSGLVITIIPDTTSTETIPTLNVNGLGAKSIKQKLSVNTALTTEAANESWMVANKPVILQYNGSVWTTIVPRPKAEDINAVLYKEQTLTDAQQAQARANVGIGHLNTTGDQRDIYVDMYGIKRGSADYAVSNSEIMSELIANLNNGFTFRFESGHYYFAEPFPHMEKHVVIKGVATNASVITDAVNYGTHLHFPNLANGQAAISIAGGVVQDIGIIGNPAICDVSFDRSKIITDPNSVVTLVDTGTTYGLKFGSWGYTVQNVRVLNCTYGIYGEICNYLIANSCAKKCKVGVSVGNDGRISNIQLTSVITGIDLRGPLVSVNNVRGDSIGKHLIECKRGKCMLSNIDGDYCVGSLIHYGGGDTKMIHLGQATNCMGRVATKKTYARNTSFDLRNIPEADYEYCSYFSIAPNTSVFGGLLDVTNVSANVFDTSSNYVHPNSVISIGEGSTVKGLVIKCSLPDGANVGYFNSNVIKNLSSYAEASNDNTNYITNFDGNTIEDISFVTPIGLARSKRTVAKPDRQIAIIDDTLQVVSDMVTDVGISIPSINLNDGVYEYGRFAAAGTEYSDQSAFRSKNYIPVEGGRTITFWFDAAEWNSNNKGSIMQVVQYDANKDILVQRVDVVPYVGDKAGLTLNANTAYIRFNRYKNSTISTPLTDIKIGLYYVEDAVLEYISPEPTIIGEKKLSLENAVIPSSTPGSTKNFYLTVNDAGVITAVEVT